MFQLLVVLDGSRSLDGERLATIENHHLHHNSHHPYHNFQHYFPYSPRGLQMLRLQTEEKIIAAENEIILAFNCGTFKIRRYMKIHSVKKNRFSQFRASLKYFYTFKIVVKFIFETIENDKVSPSFPPICVVCHISVQSLSEWDLPNIAICDTSYDLTLHIRKYFTFLPDNYTAPTTLERELLARQKHRYISSPALFVFNLHQLLSMYLLSPMLSSTF